MNANVISQQGSTEEVHEMTATTNQVERRVTVSMGIPTKAGEARITLDVPYDVAVWSIARHHRTSYSTGLRGAEEDIAALGVEGALKQAVAWNIHEIIGTSRPVEEWGGG